MEYIWKVLTMLAVAAAVVNAVINIAALFRIRMIFNCNIYITEYIMTSVVLLLLLRQLLSDGAIIVLIIAFVLIWLAVTLWFRINKMCFMRVFGIKRIMHNTIKEKLEKICAEYGIDRTSVYIYGGDSKTPCNTVVFKNVNEDVKKSVVKKMDNFLKTYSHDAELMHIISLFLDGAVVFIIYSVLSYV